MNSQINQLDRTYHFILEYFIKQGHAPHFTEIAKDFSVTPDVGKRFLHELANTGLPLWLYPNTDLIASFAPFNNFPTQYRITVDGQQKWFAQGGFEALAVCWVFPGKSIQIDAPCLDCGEPMQIVVRNGTIENHNPSEICGYVSIPLNQWSQDWPSTGSRINLFRSEEHVKNWSDFKAGTDEAILSLADIMAIVSTPRHSARMSGNFVSSVSSYEPLFFETLKAITNNAPFWDPIRRDK